MNDKRSQINCISCGRPISYLEELGDHESLNDAVGGVIQGGFDSRYDLTKLYVAVCDSCIKKGLEGGTIIHT